MMGTGFALLRQYQLTPASIAETHGAGCHELVARVSKFRQGNLVPHTQKLLEGGWHTLAFVVAGKQQNQRRGQRPATICDDAWRRENQRWARSCGLSTYRRGLGSRHQVPQRLKRLRGTSWWTRNATTGAEACALILRLYAALKRRSSTVLHAWLFPSIWLRSSLSNYNLQWKAGRGQMIWNSTTFMKTQSLARSVRTILSGTNPPLKPATT
jgi:hypothetical protein